MKILYSPDPGQGGDPATPSPAPGQPHNQSPQPAAPPAAPPTPAPALPPVAETVLTGDRTERELQLIAELERERAGRRSEQTKISQLEDQLHRLTTPPEPDPDPDPDHEGRWRPFKM